MFRCQLSSGDRVVERQSAGWASLPRRTGKASGLEFSALKESRHSDGRRGGGGPATPGTQPAEEEV